MDDIKIFDSELLLMEYLWENGPCLAVDLARVFLDKYNWKKSTTYIVLKRLEGKAPFSGIIPSIRLHPSLPVSRSRALRPILWWIKCLEAVFRICLPIS